MPERACIQQFGISYHEIITKLVTDSVLSEAESRMVLLLLSNDSLPLCQQQVSHRAMQPRPLASRPTNHSRTLFPPPQMLNAVLKIENSGITRATVTHFRRALTLVAAEVSKEEHLVKLLAEKDVLLAPAKAQPRPSGESSVGERSVSPITSTRGGKPKPHEPAVSDDESWNGPDDGSVGDDGDASSHFGEHHAERENETGVATGPRSHAYTHTEAVKKGEMIRHVSGEVPAVAELTRDPKYLHGADSYAREREEHEKEMQRAAIHGAASSVLSNPLQEPHWNTPGTSAEDGVGELGGASRAQRGGSLAEEEGGDLFVDDAPDPFRGDINPDSDMSKRSLSRLSLDRSNFTGDANGQNPLESPSAASLAKPPPL